jgi:hypothetical protein
MHAMNAGDVVKRDGLFQIVKKVCNLTHTTHATKSSRNDAVDCECDDSTSLYSPFEGGIVGLLETQVTPKVCCRRCWSSLKMSQELECVLLFSVFGCANSLSPSEPRRGVILIPFLLFCALAVGFTYVVVL